MRRRGPAGYVPAVRGRTPTERRRDTQRLVRELRKLEAVETIGGTIRNLPPPDQAPPVEEGLDVFTAADNAELYTQLRAIGAERVKIVVRWEDRQGHRHTTMMYSKGGVRASYIVAGAVAHAGDVFAFLLSELFFFKAGSGGANQARRILSVTVEYVLRGVA